MIENWRIIFMAKEKSSRRTKLTDKASIPGVLKDLTLDEKLNLIGAYKACDTLAIPDMDIPSTCWMDGATGVNATAPTFNFVTDPEYGQDHKMRYYSRIPELAELNQRNLDEVENEYKADPALTDFISRIKNMRQGGRQFISFPSGNIIGASFNRETARKFGEALGREMRESKIDTCLGPNVDIIRDPLGGRNYEMYGEDQKLVGDIAVEVVKGIQSQGTAACAKHFLANNQETNRNTKDTHLSERTLKELYAVGFERVVKEADVLSIMSAYNAINSEFTSYSHKLLTELLRDDWGFKGVVCSDWGACKTNKPDAIIAGMGLMLCGPNDMSETKAAVESGELSIKDIDKTVGYFLNYLVSLKENRQQLSAGNMSDNLTDVAGSYNQEKLLQICEDIIVDGTVLIKNDNNVLPIKTDSKVAIAGNNALELFECGTGSTMVNTGLHSNIHDELKKIMGSGNVAHCSMDTNHMPDMTNAADADSFIYVTSASAGENDDRKVMDIDEPDRSTILNTLQAAKARGLQTVVVLNVSGPVDVRRWIPYADAVLMISIPGCAGGRAAAHVITGKAAPAGKLPFTMPMRYEDSPSYPYFPGEYNDVYYEEGVFVGYKYYEKRDIHVMYPFGYGLTYTDFAVEVASDALVHDFGIDENNYIDMYLPVKIKNTGNVPGAQVIQIYISEDKPHLVRPEKELVSFEKVFLQPGEEKEVNLKIRRQDIRYFDMKRNEFLYPIGAHTLYVGTSVRDIIATIPLEIKGKKAFVLGPDSLMSDIFQSPDAIAVIDKHTGGMLSNMQEGHKSMMVHLTLSGFLGMLIQNIPDAVELDRMIKTIYKELEEL